MRIALVCPYDLDAPGGVQEICGGLAGRLSSRGDEVILVGPGSGPEAVGRPLSIRANRSTVPLSLSPTVPRSVRRLLSGADVVHVHEPLVPMVGWSAAGAPLPMVATFHADPPAWARRFYRLASGRVAARLEGAVMTAVSPVAAAAVPRRWGTPAIIPNAIDVAAYDPTGVPRIPARVAFLGRDDPRKGLDILLAAWARVVERLPEAELVVMGAHRPDPPAGVTFRGRVDGPEKRRILASSSLFVAPNLSGESFGIVLVEAMAAGCAVVASSLPAFDAVLGGHGVTVPPGRPDALAGTLISLLDDPGRIASLGERSRERARVFDWEPVTDAYRAAYESALTADRSSIRAGRSNRGTWN